MMVNGTAAAAAAAAAAEARHNEDNEKCDVRCGNLQFGAWSSGTQEAAAACIKVSH
jgi:hypothetical protein